MWISKLRWGAFAALSFAALGLGSALLWQRSEATAASRGPRRRPRPVRHRNRNEDAIWARHVGNLKRIGLAMHNYESAEGHFPPAAITGKDGKPLLSWRVAILPYLEDYDGQSRSDLHKTFQLDEPWDSPHNKALLARMPAVFASPGDGNRSPSSTAYRGFVGPGESSAPGPWRRCADDDGRRGRMGAGPGQPAKTKAELVEWKQLAERRINALPAKAEGHGGQLAGRGDEPGPKAPEQADRDQAAGGSAGGAMGAMMAVGADEVATRVQGCDGIPRGPRRSRAESDHGRDEQHDHGGRGGRGDALDQARGASCCRGLAAPRLGGSMSDGFAALFADGRVRLIDRRVDERTLRNLITPNGGEIDLGGPLPAARLPASRRVGRILGQDAGASGALLEEDSPRYAGAGTLQNAVGILKDRLNREGKGELAEWLTEPEARGPSRRPPGLRDLPARDRRAAGTEAAVRDRQAALPADRPGGDLARGLLVLRHLRR